MKKRIVSALLMAGLLIGLAGYSYNAQYVQKQEIKHFTAFFSVTGKMLNTQNDIKEMIADEIGQIARKTGLSGNPRKRHSIRTLLRENIQILFSERKCCLMRMH